MQEVKVQLVHLVKRCGFLVAPCGVKIASGSPYGGELPVAPPMGGMSHVLTSAADAEVMDSLQSLW